MNSASQKLKSVLVLAISVVIIFFIYINWSSINPIIQGIANRISLIIHPPCSRPIKYSLGIIDQQFSLSNQQVISYAEQATNVWNSALGKKLFEYSPESDDQMSVNFVYDYRQEATDQMAKIGIVIENNKATYYQLKEKYDILLASYRKNKIEMEKQLSAYEIRKKKYEDLVAYWNNQGGAPKKEYQQLEQERIYLNNLAQSLNVQQKTFNDSVETLNSVVRIMNRLASELNLSVEKYNTIGASTGEEFSEGLYISDASGVRINIYQYNNIPQLIRVLSHEFGHALGLDHVENQDSIMYHQNISQNQNLSAEDIIALKKICNIEP